MYLVIVESPTKARTLSRFLGKNYKIKASYGHVRDLPKSELGVDVEHDFKPDYVVVKKPRVSKAMKEIKDLAQEAKTLYLATDPDREGEAIAWHVAETAKKEIKRLRDREIKRVVFHEITESAIKEAFKEPRFIDLKLVDAQQARRVLDRLVGYKLSPLLWKKVMRGLSAGRVQSVAVRFVVEREREREKFKREDYFKIGAELCRERKEKKEIKRLRNQENEGKQKESAKEKFTAELEKIDGKSIYQRKTIKLFAGEYTYTKSIINSEEEAKEIVKDLEKSIFKILNIEQKEQSRYPKPPFITSTLQQEASWRLRFSPKKTMSLAQRLYENGLITYMRTDSTNISDKAIRETRQLIEKDYGKKYLPEKPTIFRKKVKQAQEAHEAIRPTNVRSGRLEVRGGKLDEDAARLYDLIWRRAVACQMAPARVGVTEVEIAVGKTTSEVKSVDASEVKKAPYLFKARGVEIKFDGFLKVYDGANHKEEVLPPLEVGDELDLLALSPEQHQTTPPPRYNEASLIKELEKFGIGRPSTYAPIMSTIQDRGYVKLEERQLIPQEIGMVVNDLLVKHFENIVDIDFTANLEDDLDEIAEGKQQWMPVVREFYEPFEKQLELKEKELKREDFSVLGPSDVKCQKCGKPMVYKLGRYGKFLSCTGWPECRNAVSINEETGEVIPEWDIKEKCEKCRAPMELRDGRFGKFFACSNYPKCKFTKSFNNTIGMKCPECRVGEVITRRTKKGRMFYGCSRYPDCKWASWKKPTAEGGKEKEN